MGEIDIAPDLALRLAMELGTPPSFWTNLQENIIKYGILRISVLKGD